MPLTDHRLSADDRDQQAFFTDRLLQEAIAAPERRTRTTDPATSLEAAEDTEDKVFASQAEVLTLLREHGPMTDHEIQSRHVYETIQNPTHTRFSDSRLRSARSELVRLGVVEFTGEHKKIASRRRARVWRVKAVGA